MRRSIPWALALATFALLALPAALPACAETNINFFLGSKGLDDDDWAGAEDQGEFGVTNTISPPSWPVGIAIDALVSARTDTVYILEPPVGIDLNQGTFELDLGVRKIWRNGKSRPFVGGGIASIGAGREIVAGSVSIDDSDSGGGVWVNGGAFWRLGKKFNIGVDARFSSAEVTLEGQEIQAGGFHLGLLLGWGWGE